MSKEKTYRLKIDLGQGVFEAEGTKEFVEEKFKEFKEVTKEGRTFSPAGGIKGKTPSVSTLKRRARKGKGSTGGQSPSIVKDLNLIPKDKESLKDFHGKKSPETNLERNTVFVYYLIEILGRTGITMNHIYTCYRAIGLRLPGNIKQSITDSASGRYGFLDATKGEDIKMTSLGQNLVMHDLPRKPKK